jgi:hypothetical protein
MQQARSENGVAMKSDGEQRLPAQRKQGKNLFEQTKGFADRAVSAANDALTNATTIATGFSESVGTAMSNTAVAYLDTVNEVRDSLPKFKDIVAQAARMPGVSVNRASYLSTTLGKRYGQRIIQAAIETTPARAGITDRDIERAARNSIAKERQRTTLISAAAGIPGGVAMAATVPADLVQFWMHLLRVLQKLSYLYGWGDLVSLNGREPDDSKRAALVLFLAMMAGVEEADDALRSLAILRVSGAREAELRNALLREPYNSAVAASSAALSSRLATRVTGQVAEKTVPIVGGFISGKVSNASFNDMAKRLHKQLKTYGG